MKIIDSDLDHLCGELSIGEETLHVKIWQRSDVYFLTNLCRKLTKGCDYSENRWEKKTL